LGGLLFLTLKQKGIAVVVAAVLSAGGAAAFASQQAVFQGPDSASTQLVDETATVTPEPSDVTPTATEAVDEDTPTPTPTAAVDEDTPTPTPAADEDTPTPTATAEDEDNGPREIGGIPDDNPSKSPEDGDGVCEKGETVIKTTPSGKQVVVPCQADKSNKTHGHGNPSDGDDQEETE
jgi:hypothetical protein